MSTQTWLTQEAADRLRAELEFLETTGRAEIIKKIETARGEGDLKENGGYHAAREEQGKMEARIRQLKHMLEHSHIGAPLPVKPALSTPAWSSLLRSPVRR
jgi:transcription elongation factor GreA